MCVANSNQSNLVIVEVNNIEIIEEDIIDDDESVDEEYDILEDEYEYQLEDDIERYLCGDDYVTAEEADIQYQQYLLDRHLSTQLSN